MDSNTTTTYKSQKGSKDIVKIVHVTSVTLIFMKLRKYFLCAKKTEIKTLFIIFCVLKMNFGNEGLTGLERHEGWLQIGYKTCKNKSHYC